MTAIQRTKFEVAQTAGGWAVKREGLGLDSTHPTKAAAVKRAAQLANDRQPSELTIYKQDGSVQEIRTYGTDPERMIKL
jgi:hypothetical protein